MSARIYGADPVAWFNERMAVAGRPHRLRVWHPALWVLSETPVPEGKVPGKEHGALLVFGPADAETAVDQGLQAVRRAMTGVEASAGGNAEGTVVSAPWQGTEGGGASLQDDHHDHDVPDAIKHDVPDAQDHGIEPKPQRFSGADLGGANHLPPSLDAALAERARVQAHTAPSGNGSDLGAIVVAMMGHMTREVSRITEAADRLAPRTRGRPPEVMESALDAHQENAELWLREVASNPAALADAIRSTQRHRLKLGNEDNAKRRERYKRAAKRKAQDGQSGPC
jgi:hypothetical protein